MTKDEFLWELDARLDALPVDEREKSLDYYKEIIDDMTENGCTEEEAVAQLGQIEKIAEEILLDAPLTTLMLAKARSKHTMQAWEIVLLVIGAVVWLPLLIAFFGVVLSVYLCIWAVIISLFAVVLAFAVSAVAVPVGMALLIALVAPIGLSGILMAIGAALVLAGLAVAFFIAALKLTKCLVKLSGYFLRRVKRMFLKKEAIA